MAENSSPSPQISQNPSLSSPQIPLSPQLPPLHPQNPNPNPNPSNSNPNPNPNPSNSNPNQMMASSLPNPTFQSLQRAGSVPRLQQLQQQQQQHQHQQQQVAAARQFGGGVAQMSFGGSGGGAQISGQQGMAARIGQAGQQIPMLPGQSMQQYNNMQAQLLMQQPRQKTGVVQGMQFNSANSSGQALQGMQAMGMMGSLGMNQQIRANGTLYNQQRMIQQRQQIALQNSLPSPQKLPGQNLQRGPSLTVMNSQYSGLTQNGQSTPVQNALSQQPWLKHMQQGIPGPVSPSHPLQQQQRQQQQQAFSPQQPSSSQLQQQKSIGLTQQQISQLMHQQAQLGSPRQHPSQQQQLLQQHHQQIQLQLLQQQFQQQSQRMPGSGFQKSISLTGSQPGTPASVTTATGGNSSQGAEASNQLLGKRKIQDLVSQVDPLGKLDPAVEDLLLEIADDFIDSVTAFACSLAKHRKSSTLESKDLLLHLEKNLHLTIPGFTKEGQKFLKEPLPKDVHSRRLEVLRTSVESQPFDKETIGRARGGVVRQAATDPSLNHPLKPSPSSDQLLLSATAAQMLHKAPQF